MMYVITIITVSVISCILLYRVLCLSGCKLPGSEKESGLFSANTPVYTGYSYTAKDLLCVAGESLAFRLVLYLVSFLLLKLTYQMDQSFLEWWLKWDATNYTSIAAEGYKGIVLHDIPNIGDAYQTLVFFPLYPLLMRIVNLILNNINLSALVTSTLCYVGGCIFIFMAVAMRYGKSIARKTVVLLSVFTFGFFSGAMMPESTFLLVGGACIYFTNKKNWWFAGVFGFLASLSRLQGVLLLSYIGIEWLEEYKIFLLIRTKQIKELTQKLVYLIPMCFVPLGSFVYLLINYLNTGDWFYFMKLQQNVWGHSFVNVGKAMQIIADVIGTSSEKNVIISVYVPHIIMFFGVMYLIVYCLRRHKDSLAVFLIIYTVISFSTDFLVSGGRYLSIAIPLFVLLGELSEEHPILYRFLIGLFLTTQVVFMGCYLSGQHMVT